MDAQKQYFAPQIPEKVLATITTNQGVVITAMQIAATTGGTEVYICTVINRLIKAGKVRRLAQRKGPGGGSVYEVIDTINPASAEKGSDTEGK